MNAQISKESKARQVEAEGERPKAVGAATAEKNGGPAPACRGVGKP